jgi:hypothetical protein
LRGPARSRRCRAGCREAHAQEDAAHVTRRTLSLIPIMASLLLAVTALPVGAFNEAVNTGDTGFYTIADEAATPGVRCLYKDLAGKKNDRLNKIRIRPFHSHGPYAQKTHVGYRFIVKRQPPPFTGPFKTVYKSPVVKKLANDTEVAFFPARTWTAPTNTKANFRVQVILLFYAPGSQKNVVGRVRGLMEAYLHRLTSTKSYVLGDMGDAGFCRRNYHGL